MQAKEILSKYGLFNTDTQKLVLPKLYIKVIEALPEDQVITIDNGIVSDIVKDKKPEKTFFSELVSLTESEYQKLFNEHGKYWAGKMIEILNNYKASSGKKYKSDYHAILSWVVTKVKDSPDYARYRTRKLKEEAQSKERKQSGAIEELKDSVLGTNKINKLVEDEEE